MEGSEGKRAGKSVGIIGAVIIAIIIVGFVALQATGTSWRGGTMYDIQAYNPVVGYVLSVIFIAVIALVMYYTRETK